MARHDAPTVQTFGDHEVIVPSHKLHKAVSKVSASDPNDDPVARAEAALQELSGEFAGWMDSELERLDKARKQLKTRGFTHQIREEMFHAAHDIKGDAATFGFPAAAPIADSLCRLIEHTPNIARIPLSVVDQHVDAIRAIVRELTKSDSDEIAVKLGRRLREVTDEFLAHENRHRPEYLDGILAPPIAPEE
jgi:HPt (histidine-containing phosphotransfer) domain-containing protein